MPGMTNDTKAAAEKRITRARTRLLLDFPWFGSLSMRLRVERDDSFSTMATNGTVLKYNAEFVLGLPEAELVGVMAHEVMHCALLHPYRRGSRDMARWNEACDYAINTELKDAGLQLPADVLYDDAYRGLAAEVIYAQRTPKPQPEPEQEEQPQPDPDAPPREDGFPDPQPQPPEPDAPPEPGSGDESQDDVDASGPGQPSEKPLSTGTFSDAPAPEPGASDADQPMSAEDWKIAADQATKVARAAGKMPGGVERATKESRESVEDWRAVLREFIEHTAPSDYSWTTPNRRHVSAGIYLPGTVRENLGAIAVAVDTSGSIGPDVLNAFAQELTAIVQEARPERVSVIYCDASIQHTEEFTADDPEIKLNAKGGGGTRFCPVFDHIAGQDQPPVCLLYFTDLDCYDRPEEPEYPVLWVTGLGVTKDGPFGRTVRVDVNL
jgi:predicted metal-dependent peptidase